MFNFGIAEVGPMSDNPLEGPHVLVTLTNTDRVWFRIVGTSRNWFVSLIMPRAGSYEIAGNYDE